MRKTDEAVEEICAEAALLRAAGERLMRRRDHPHVDPHRLVLADPLQFAAFQKTQQLGLKRQRHLTDLVQKQRAAIRRLNPSRPPLHRAGEGASRMPKKLGLQQRLRNGRAVQRDERAARHAG